MAERINLGWLKDYTGVKFAPKTIASQIFNEDGTKFTDYINQQIESLSNSITNIENGDIIIENATIADKLNVGTIGDYNTPVYFNDGVPTICTSLDLDTTGNAATATEAQALSTEGTILTDLSSTYPKTYTSGGNITPGVVGILPIKNGGTSGHTVKEAQTNLDLDKLLWLKNESTYEKFGASNIDFAQQVSACGQIGSKYIFIVNRSTTYTLEIGSEMQSAATNLPTYTRDIAFCGGYFVATASTWRVVDSGILDDQYFTIIIYTSTDGITWTQRWSKEYNKGNLGDYAHLSGAYYDETNATARVVCINAAGNLITINSTNMTTWSETTHSVTIGDYGKFGGLYHYEKNLIAFFSDNDGYFYSTNGGVSWNISTNSIGFNIRQVQNFFALPGHYYAFVNNTLYHTTQLGTTFTSTSYTLASNASRGKPSLTADTQFFPINEVSVGINMGTYWNIFTLNNDNGIICSDIQHTLHIPVRNGISAYTSLYLNNNLFIYYNPSYDESTYLININNQLLNKSADSELLTLNNQSQSYQIKKHLGINAVLTFIWDDITLAAGISWDDYSSLNTIPIAVDIYSKNFHTHFDLKYGHYYQNECIILRNTANKSLDFSIKNQSLKGHPGQIVVSLEQDETYNKYYMLPQYIIIDNTISECYVTQKNLTWKDALCSYGTLQDDYSFVWGKITSLNDLIQYNNKQIYKYFPSGRYTPVTIYDPVEPSSSYTYVTSV